MIDTHCHLDQFLNPFETLKYLEKHGVKTISVTNLPSHFEEGYRFYEKFEFTIPALGFHPLMIKNDIDIENEIRLFKKFVTKTDFIGEVGLDFSSREKDFIDIQKYIFEQIVSHVTDFDKIFSIHSRKAENEIFRILNKYSIRKVILHWFTGSTSQAKKALELGYYFSINKNMLSTNKGKKLIDILPKERVLIETDSPFTCSKNSHYPLKKLSIIYQTLSKYWGFSEEKTFNIVSNNFKELRNRNPEKKVA